MHLELVLLFFCLMIEFPWRRSCVCGNEEREKLYSSRELWLHLRSSIRNHNLTVPKQRHLLTNLERDTKKLQKQSHKKKEKKNISPRQNDDEKTIILIIQDSNYLSNIAITVGMTMHALCSKKHPPLSTSHREKLLASKARAEQVVAD